MDVIDHPDFFEEMQGGWGTVLGLRVSRSAIPGRLYLMVGCRLLLVEGLTRQAAFQQVQRIFPEGKALSETVGRKDPSGKQDIICLDSDQ